MFRGILKSIKNRKTHYKKLEEADSKLRIAIEKYLNMVCIGHNQQHILEVVLEL